MSDKLINAVIQLTSKEERAGKFGPMAKLKDEKGLTYTVYKTKKDGTVSVAWEQLQTLSVGDNVQVSFAEEIVNHPEHGTYTARTIRSFNPDIGNGMTNSSASKESSNLSHSGASQRGSSDAFGRRLAIHGFVNGMLGAGATVETITKDLPALLRLEDTIDLALSAPLDGANRDLPIIQQDENYSGDDLPF
jgi:hypothetical protein